MFIVCQKFRSHTLGYYIRLCHIITCNTHKTWGLTYLRAMRTLPTSCHMLPHMQWHHAHITRHTHTGKLATLTICGMPGITYGHAVCAGQMIFIKITTSNFSTLNMKFANWNVLKRILIAMLSKNKADWNENFRKCAEEPVAPLYK